MPKNNNQKKESAADRLVKLPILHSACAKLSVLYSTTKCSHPSLKRLCEVLENSVTVLSTMATDRISPVIVKLEPQISAANDAACKSLDWLESAFPVLLTPTEEVVACAKDRMLAVQEAVSIATKTTMGTVEHVMGIVLQGDNQNNRSLVDRTIMIASLSLDCALNVSEALIDRMLPPTENNQEEDPRLVEGFEAKSLGYSTRIVLLASKMYMRIYEKVMETIPSPSGVSLDIQTRCSTLVRNVWMLPTYLHHQAMSLLIYILHMYNLNTPKKTNSEVRRLVHVFETPNQKNVFKIHSQDSPDWTIRSRLTREPISKEGCNDNSCVNH